VVADGDEGLSFLTRMKADQPTVGWVEPKAKPIIRLRIDDDDGFPPDQVRGQPILRVQRKALSRIRVDPRLKME
jgi:hypothetical protein